MTLPRAFTAEDVAIAIAGVVAAGKNPLSARIDPVSGAIEIMLGKSLAEQVQSARFETLMLRRSYELADKI